MNMETMNKLNLRQITIERFLVRTNLTEQELYTLKGNLKYVLGSKEILIKSG